MAFSNFIGPLGKALSDAALGYTQGLLDTPKAQDERDEYAQNRRLRPLEIQQKELDLQKTQADIAKEKAALDKPYVTPHGVYAKNAQGTHVFTPFPVKDVAQVAQDKLMAEWLHSDDPQQRQIAQAWLSKMQAPSQQAKARADLVQPHIDHLKRQEEYWNRLAANAERHNSIIAQHYRQQAGKSTAEIQTLTAVIGWLEHGTPEQKEAAANWLMRKRDRPGRVGR